MKHLLKVFKSRKIRLAISVGVFVLSFAGMFAAPFLFPEEPVAVLELSIFALLLTSFDSISTNIEDE